MVIFIWFEVCSGDGGCECESCEDDEEMVYGFFLINFVLWCVCWLVDLFIDYEVYIFDVLI